MNYTGSFMGRVLIQGSNQIGGLKYVFVPLEGQKNDYTFPLHGGKVMNPFKGEAKMFAGDLVEYRPNMDNDDLGNEIWLFKTYRVAKAAAAADVEIFIERDGYKHIPFAGDILMKAPAALTGTAAADTVVSVEETKDGNKNVWKVTLAAAIGALAVGDVLVEGLEKGAGKKMLVSNPNMLLHVDYDFFYAPSKSPADYKGARSYLTPTMHGTMFTHRMSPMPPSVLALNKTRVAGWYEI